jgi:hypothetical protein
MRRPRLVMQQYGTNELPVESMRTLHPVMTAFFEAYATLYQCSLSAVVFSLLMGVTAFSNGAKVRIDPHGNNMVALSLFVVLVQPSGGGKVTASRITSSALAIDGAVSHTSPRVHRACMDA